MTDRHEKQRKLLLATWFGEAHCGDMTTIQIDFPCSPLLAEARRTAPPVQRWIARVRRFVQPPLPSQTPSDRVLDGMPEARSLHR